MSIPIVPIDASAVQVSCDAASLYIGMADGREITVPLAWFPRLRDASPVALTHWRLIGGGMGIHWPDIDEDILVESLLRLA
jgi:hypothetical protein